MKASSTRATGRVSVHPRGFGFLNFECSDGETSAFIAPPELNSFLDGDLATGDVAVDALGRASVTNLVLASRSRTDLFGTVTTRGRRKFLKVDRLVANTDWPFVEGTADDLVEGTHVVALVGNGAVTPTRVVQSQTDVGLERCIVRHGLRSTFSDRELAEAKEATLRPLPGGRRDLRDLVTVTIDAPTTTDIDDALSVIPAGPDGGLRVLVSIADVDAFVPEGSLLDQEAKRRGTSVYLAGRVIPMLPEELSSDSASLVQDKDRLVVTAELRIDAEGRVTSVDLYEAILRSTARLTYSAVSELFRTGTSPSIPASVIPSLRWLRTAGARLSSVRAGRGGVELGRDEAYVSFDPETREPVRVEARTDTEAHRLIERLMVAANEAVAEWLVTRGLPGVFRVHDTPSPDRVKSLAEFASNFGIEAGFGPELSPRGLSAFEAQFRETAFAPAMRTVLGKALGPARYTVHPGPHFGLAAPLYLHFTSPLRRYPDLMVHRLIKRYLRGDRTMVPNDDAIELVAQHLNRAALVASKAETSQHRAVVARWFRSRVGETIAGNIVAVKPFGLVVQMACSGAVGTVSLDALPDGPYHVEALGHAASSDTRRYTVGEPLTVTVISADEDLGRIELAPA